jgi:hypothetical protein
MSKRKNTVKIRKQFSFRKGDSVTFKDDKEAERAGAGVVWSCPAQIGEKRTCRIPGGPLVMEDMMFVTWKIKDKNVLCIEEIKLLKRVK